MTLKPKKSFTNHRDYANSDADADKRFRKALDVDPFPNIPCSLLNSADIADYIRMTGMLHPFGQELIKSASCEVQIGDKCIYWDEKGKLNDLDLKDDKSFDLLPNSIVFVNTKQKVRLPKYIAIRFNLRIVHVHQGILLGTGPLVDPGFEGRLLIPLHNLTANKYSLRAGDPIAWVDFTKISPNEWTEEYDQIKISDKLKGTYIDFPEEKKNLQPWDYLYDAYSVKPSEGSVQDLVANFYNHRRTIRSSIPDALEDAKKEMRRLRNYAWGGFLVAALGVFGTGWVVVDSGADILSQINTRIDAKGEISANALSEVKGLRGEIIERLKTLDKNDTNLNTFVNETYKKRDDEFRARLLILVERIKKLEKELEQFTTTNEESPKKSN